MKIDETIEMKQFLMKNLLLNEKQILREKIKV